MVILKFLPARLVFPTSLFSLGISVLTATQATEENKEKNMEIWLLHKHKEMIFSKEKDEVLDLQNNSMDVEGAKEPLFPIEIFSIIFSYVEQFTLIQADTVCQFFKKMAESIWNTKLLDLSRKLETPTQKGFSPVKTFAALESGRYKNVRLQYCGLGDMDISFSLKDCKILDLSHNNICAFNVFCFNGVCEHLQELNLSYNTLDKPDRSLKSYSTPALRKLNLSYNNLSKTTVTDLKKSYTHLETLILEPQEEIQLFIPRLGGLKHWDVRVTREYS